MLARRAIAFWTIAVLQTTWAASAFSNTTTSPSAQAAFYDVLADRPDGCPACPRCFDCHYSEFKCLQYGECSNATGKCECPTGFGGEDCSKPLCGSPAQGKYRKPREEGHDCECEEGWGGVNCNVCQTDKACNALMIGGEGGVCHKHGLVVTENFQTCKVTNKPILDQIAPRIPEATFSCNAKDKTCNFQFWVDRNESFYCALDTCGWKEQDTDSQNQTIYKCEHMQCSCVKGRFLCGEAGSIDISAFLATLIKGPAQFVTRHTAGGNAKDGSRFEEPAMNNLISNVFGEAYISLDCQAGECLYFTDVPGWKKPVPSINTPKVAGIVAGCALLLLAIALTSWYLARRAAYKKWGAIRLEDEDDDPTKLMYNHKPMALQFQNVSYNIKGKEILSNISGVAHPGQIMAIMGASGAGKSTFLDILARKNKRGVTAGNMYVNGEKILDKEYRNVVGYVDQEDTLIPTLTVHETILNSALLRLPADMGISTKEERVIEVMQQLGIFHIKDSMIGSEDGNGRGISGGEKRRVGIACELVTSPSILFLDEPTSGLDAFNAFNVIECLVTLAKTYNRTVIFTIHQPRSNIVALFDQLILLAKGRTVYSGPFASCQSYFDHIGYSCPPGFNIADYLVDLTMHASMPVSPILENVSREISDRDGLANEVSSTRAVKSVRSITSGSIASTENFLSVSARPNVNRRVSLKQKQDRQLFTRKKSSGHETPPTPKTDDEDNGKGTGEPRSWLRLAPQGGPVPPQILEDPDNLPPEANNDLDILVTSFRDSDIAKSIHDDISTSIRAASSSANGHAFTGDNVEPVTGSIRGFRRVSIPRQFIILSKRTWRNLYRNPMLMLTHYAVAILLGVLSGWLFYGITNDIGGFQNRLGLFFFLLALFGFSTLTSLTTFSSERMIFIRERANGYYAPISYFLSKVIFDIVPLRLLPPIIMGVIVYPMTGLQPYWPVFLTFILILVLFNLAASAICLTIGIIFKDGAVANLVGSLVMLFSLLFAGLLLNLNHDSVGTASLWLQKLSIFHYGYEGLLVNEVSKLRLNDNRYGLHIAVPGASILSAFGFDNLALWSDVLGLGVFAAVFIVIAYIAMHFLLVEKR